jgi:WD40 repeat protein
MNDPAAHARSCQAEPPDPAASPPELLARLLQEQRRRWRVGDHTLVEAYLERYPALRDDAEAILDLLYNEFALREERGEAPLPEDYCARFPDLASPFRIQLQLHQAFSLKGLVSAAPATETAPEVTGPPAPAPAEHLPCLPDYEILGVLGRGGMGIVYKARQVPLERTVALKMIGSGAGAGPHELARFRTEARSAARLQHPNIVQIHEVGEYDGRPYLTLEFLDGRSLAQRLGGRPLPAGQAAQLVGTLARAMHYAHGRGVIHRDLKPANVLLAADGTPKITDFGLACRLDAAAGLTQTGVLLGTPSYMAPEQAAGRARATGPATDVYSLGAILYELLTGRPPFLGETALHTLEQVRSQEPVPPSRLQPGVPRDLETVCLKCLQKEPAKRYATAEALADDLGRFLSGRPIAARRTGAAERAWRWCRRNPAVASLAGALALLLGAAAAGGTLSAVLFARERDEAVTQRKEAQKARRAAIDGQNEAIGQREEAQKARQEAVERLREALVAQAQKSRVSTARGRRFDSVEAIRKAAAIRPSLELRNLAIECLTLADVRPAPVGTPGEQPLPEAERYVYADDRGNLRVCRFADGAEVRRLSGPEGRAWVWHLSPGGRFVAAKFHPPGRERPNALWVWDLDGEGNQPVLKVPTGVCEEAFGFSPDGGRLAVGDHEGQVTLYDLPSAAPGRRLARGPAPRCLAFRPGGPQLTVADRDSAKVRTWDTSCADQLAWERDYPAPVRCLAWHPEGRLLAAGCGDFHIYVWDAAFRRDPLVLRGHEAEFVQVAFNHGGDLLYSFGWAGTRLWDPWTGQEFLEPRIGGRVQFSRDDRWLREVEGPNGARWEVSAGRECRALHGHTGYKGPWGAGWGADGRLLASAGSDGVRLWDPAAGRELAFQDLPGAQSALLHPRGDSLITCGASGLQRWPITPDPEGPDKGSRIGAPQALAALAPVPHNRGCLGPDGRTLAVADHGRGQVLVLDLEDQSCKALPGGHPYVTEVALSPDGRWLVSNAHGGAGGLRVWDLRSGQLAKELPCRSAFLAFSPDGRWLAKGTAEGYALLKVGSWEVEREVKHRSGMALPLAFSPDGALLAISSGGGTGKVWLVKPATGEEVATLADTRSGIISWLCFSPDGSQLAVTSENHLVRVWDLRRIRRHLAGMGLDWDGPD